MSKRLRDKNYYLTNMVFDGEISLSLGLTHYATYQVTTNVAVTLKPNPIIGGSAEIRMVADGTHAPVFSSSFTKSGGSEDFDTTASAINKVIFYYDGVDAFYSITVL